MRDIAEETMAAMQDLAPPASIYLTSDVTATLDTLLAALATERLPDVARLPFAYDARMVPAEIGRELASTYETYGTRSGPDLATLIAAGCDWACVSSELPERRAAMAASVLASVPSRNAYHNVNHTREVLASAVWLCHANAALARRGVPGAVKLDGRSVAMLLLLATMHDVGHDGGSNFIIRDGVRERVAFRLEDRSFALMRDVLLAAGFGSADLEAMQAIVRATDPAVRPAARAVTDHILLGTDAPCAVPPEFEPLMMSPEIAILGALLADADILSSAGLTADYQYKQNARLETEFGFQFPCKDVLAFFDVIVGGSMASAAGRQLDDNLRTIRADVVHRCVDPDRPPLPRVAPDM